MIQRKLCPLLILFNIIAFETRQSCAEVSARLRTTTSFSMTCVRFSLIGKFVFVETLDLCIILWNCVDNSDDAFGPVSKRK